MIAAVKWRYSLNVSTNFIIYFERENMIKSNNITLSISLARKNDHNRITNRFKICVQEIVI